MYLSHLFLCFALLLYPFTKTFSQQYSVKLYTNNDGLAQMQVMSVFADSRGLVWVSTKYGISRFNGDRFDNLPPHFLKGAEFGYMAEDRRGNLWFTQTYAQGTTFYDGHTARKITSLVNPIYFDHQNRGWTFTADKHLAYFWQDSLYRADALLPQLRHKQIESLFYDEARRQLLIITHSNESYLYRNNQLRAIPFPLQQSPPEINTRELRIQQSPNLFIIKGKSPHQPKAITYFYFDGQHFVPFLDYSQPGEKVTILKPMSSDYFISLDGKTYRVEPGSTRLQFVISTFSNGPYARMGSSFFIGMEQGLCRLTDTGFRHFSRADAPYVWSVAEDRQGTIWWMNYRSPLRTWNGQSIKIRTDYTLPNNDWYFGSRRGKDGNLYLGYSHGIVRFDGHRYTQLRPTDSTQSAWTWALHEDTLRGVLLQGTSQYVNVFKNGRLIRQLGTADKLPEFGDHFAITQDKQGNYWIGGHGGICRYNPDTRQVVAYIEANKRFPRATVSGLAFDKNGTLWIASTRGLAYLDTKTDSIRQLAPDRFQTPVYYLGVAGNALFAGDLHTLWVLDLEHFHATNGQLRLKGFNQHNGFFGIEPGQNGFFHDSKNRIWIPSGSVLSYLDLTHLTFTYESLRTAIYAVNDSILAFRYRPDSVLALPYGQTTTKISYEAIGFDRTDHTQYRYKLDDGTWSEWLTRSDVYLTDLTDGLHAFTIEARRNSLLSGPPTLTTMHFRAWLPFWQWTGFFYLSLLMVGCGIGAVGYLTYRDRYKSLKLQEQDQQLLFLQVQTLQAQLNPHFVFNVLGTIQQMIMTDDRERANQNLLRLAQLIRNFLESSIRSDLPRKSRSAELEIRLDKELELLRLYIEFEALQYRARFQFDIDVAPGLEPALWTLPPMLVQPFVENAIKHGLLYRSTPGQLWIRCSSYADEGLLIDIEDDGVGRAEAKRRQAESIRPYISRGGQLVERRIQVLNTIGYHIRLTISDRPNGGTHVQILINTNGK